MTETFFYVATAVVVTAAVGVVILVVRLLSKLTRVVDQTRSTLERAEKLLGHLSDALPATLESIEKLAGRTTHTLDNADRQLNVLGEALEQFQQISRRINSFEQRLQEKVEGPLMDAAKVVAGVTKAIKVFADAFNRR
ncbi:MAG: hypothetical protein N2663_08340 [Chlorobi bacterium]|nr:hypothetical protein [Chlorobiota bacterium]